METLYESEQIRAAFRTAGCAVAHALLLDDVQQVTITELGLRLRVTTRETLPADLLCLLVGALAEESVITPEEQAADPKRYFITGDVEKCYDLADELNVPQSEFDELMNAAVYKAPRFEHKYWLAIHAVATALLERNQLSSLEVSTIIQQKVIQQKAVKSNSSGDRVRLLNTQEL